MLEGYFDKGRELVGRISSLGYLLERGFFVFACGVLLAGLVALSGGSRGFSPAKAEEVGAEPSGAPAKPQGVTGERYRSVREIIGR